MSPKYYNKLRIIGYPVLGALLYLELIMINSFDRVIRTWQYYTWQNFCMEYGFCVLFAFVLLESGLQLNLRLSRWIKWSDKVIKRFFIQYLLQATIVTGIIQLFFSFHFPDYFGYDSLLVTQVKVIGVVFSLIITGYFAGEYFFLSWNAEKLKAAQLEKDTTVAHLEALRLQLDPHFLFNNLSILSSLVEGDTKNAVKYIQRLSAIYRYILNNRKSDIIGLDKEIDFIRDYLYLYEVRYGKSIQLDLQEKPDFPDWGIPPLSLQLLVENAIKHNAFELKHPLVITLRLDKKNNLVISNNKQYKESTESGQIGLQNIRNRCRLLGWKEPAIINSENNFTVILSLEPLKEQ